MRLTQDDTVVHTLASDRSDQPFVKAILPGRSRCDGFVPNTHGAQSACNDRAIDLIPIADEIGRRQRATRLELSPRDVRMSAIGVRADIKR
jgi:hypothetical protein